MSNVEPGEILISEEIACTRGHLKANEGSDLVHIFLGTVPRGHRPGAESMLNKLGWVRTDFYEVEVEVNYEDDEGVLQERVQRTMYQADTPAEALHAAARFAGSMTPQGCTTALSVAVVRLGKIDHTGSALHQRGGYLLQWNQSHPAGTIEQAIEALLAT